MPYFHCCPGPRRHWHYCTTSTLSTGYYFPLHYYLPLLLLVKYTTSPSPSTLTDTIDTYAVYCGALRKYGLIWPLSPEHCYTRPVVSRGAPWCLVKLPCHGVLSYAGEWGEMHCAVCLFCRDPSIQA